MSSIRSIFGLPAALACALAFAGGGSVGCAPTGDDDTETESDDVTAARGFHLSPRAYASHEVGGEWGTVRVGSNKLTKILEAVGWKAAITKDAGMKLPKATAADSVKCAQWYNSFEIFDPALEGANKLAASIDVCAGKGGLARIRLAGTPDKEFPIKAPKFASLQDHFLIWEDVGDVLAGFDEIVVRNGPKSTSITDSASLQRFYVDGVFASEIADDQASFDRCPPATMVHVKEGGVEIAWIALDCDESYRGLTMGKLYSVRKDVYYGARVEAGVVFDLKDAAEAK